LFFKEIFRSGSGRVEMAKKPHARRRPVHARKPLFSSPPLRLLSELSKAEAATPVRARPSDFTPITIGELAPHPEPESFSLRPAKPATPSELPPPALSSAELAQLMPHPLPIAPSRPRRAKTKKAVKQRPKKSSLARRR
jgi:hypothetical protein